MTSRILFFETENMKHDWKGNKLHKSEGDQEYEYSVWVCDLRDLLDFHIKMLNEY